MKKRISNTFKTIKENEKDIKEYVEKNYLNEDNIAVVKVYLKESDIYSNISDDSDFNLNGDFYDFIERESYPISLNYPLQININTDASLNSDLVQDKIYHHYLKDLLEIKEKIRNCKVIAGVLLAFGILFLSIYFVLQITSNNEIFDEIISIIGSFCIWETIDYFIIKRGELRRDYYRILRLANADVKIINKK